MKSIALVFGVVLLVPAVTSAGMGALSLREAIETALARNHQLKASGHELKGAGEQAAASRSRYLPRIHLEEGVVATNSATRTFMLKLDEGRFFLGGDLNHPETASDFRTSISLHQPLLDFSLGAGVEMAQTEAKRFELAHERQREETAFRVLVAYLAVQQAKAGLVSTEQAVSDAGEHLRLASLRTEAGMGLKADELRARTFLTERELERIRAANDLRLARLKLARAAGGKSGSTADIREGVRPFELGLNSNELVRLAMEKRSDLRQAAAGVARADAAVGLARAAYLPTVYGSASYQMNDRDVPFGRDNDAWTVGAVFRWDLFDGLQRNHEAAGARARKEAAGELLEELRADIALEVEEKYLRREEARQRLEVVRNTLRDAEEAVRLVTRRFENSLATIVETLDAQTALDRGRTQLVEAETGLARATAELWHAAGILLREVLK